MDRRCSTESKKLFEKQENQSGMTVDGDQSVVVERLPVDEAFELLAHETRVRILEALKTVDGDPLAFAELRRKVGVRDPGQFNYHLGKLTPRFVRNGDEGYELTSAGGQVVGAVLSGGYTKALDADPIPMDASCLECGGQMETHLQEDRVKVTCTECGSDYANIDIPPGILDGWSREEVPAVISRWLKRLAQATEYGFCHNCDGHLVKTVHTASDDDAPEWIHEGDLDAIVTFECQRCSGNWKSVVEVTILAHPAVVAFHYEHGIDLRKTPNWDLDWLDPFLATVTSENPLRIEIPITLDGETRIFVFDEDLDVVDEFHE